MSRAPSVTTQLRNTRWMLKNMTQMHKLVVDERDAYRARATKAEQEAAEWRRRFDQLLAIKPEATR